MQPDIVMRANNAQTCRKSLLYHRTWQSAKVTEIVIFSVTRQEMQILMPLRYHRKQFQFLTKTILLYSELLHVILIIGTN